MAGRRQRQCCRRRRAGGPSLVGVRVALRSAGEGGRRDRGNGHFSSKICQLACNCLHTLYHVEWSSLDISRAVMTLDKWGKFVSFKCKELGKCLANSIAPKGELTMNFVHFFQLPSGQSTHFQSVVHPDGQSHQFQTQTVHEAGNVIAARDEINQVGSMLVCNDMPSVPLTSLTHIVCVRISFKSSIVPLPAKRRLRNLQLSLI